MNNIMEIQYIFHKGKQKKLYYCAECKFKSIHAAAYKAHIHTNKHIYMLTGDSNYQPPVILQTKNELIKRLKQENQKLKDRVTFFEEEVVEIIQKLDAQHKEDLAEHRRIFYELVDLYEKK